MNVFVPYESRQTIGGGYTFYRNFVDCMADAEDFRLVEESEDFDILFAFSPTTVSGESITRAKGRGAKFILRIDGVPEDNRNSGKGTRRLIEYASLADYIIYQTKFIQQTIGPILKNNGIVCPHRVIRNGVNTHIFTPEGSKENFPGKPNILHIAYRKDNNKRYEEVLAMYREYFMNNKQANLVLLGRYPTEWQEFGMGFFNGERYNAIGTTFDDAYKARIIKSCDFLFYPSFADPCPNVVMEAMACGVPILYQPYGGVREMVQPGMELGGGIWIDYNESFTDNINVLLKERENFSKRALAIAQEHTLEIMSANYISAFETALTH